MQHEIWATSNGQNSIPKVRAYYTWLVNIRYMVLWLPKTCSYPSLMELRMNRKVSASDRPTVESQGGYWSLLFRLETDYTSIGSALDKNTPPICRESSLGRFESYWGYLEVPIESSHHSWRPTRGTCWHPNLLGGVHEYTQAIRWLAQIDHSTSEDTSGILLHQATDSMQLG